MYDYNDFPKLQNTINMHSYFKEQICILYFNLNRKNNVMELDKLSVFFSDLLCSLKTSIQSSKDDFIPYLNLVVKMIAHTRDPYYGKGEHDVSYMLLYVLYQHYPTLSVFLLYRFVLGECPFGSWRDVKYLCDFVRRNSSNSINDSFIHVCLELVNTNLKKELYNWQCASYKYLNNVSLCSSHTEFENLIKPNPRDHLSSLAKWIPREQKKFDWLYDKLVLHWFNKYEPYYFNNIGAYDNYLKIFNKARMQYRKTITKLNKAIDTVEIKLCASLWSDIVPENIPQLALMKHKNNIIHLSYFQNMNNENHKTNICFDKFKCSHKIQKHLRDKFNPHINLYREHLNPHIFMPICVYVKEAFKIIQNQRLLHNSPFYQNHIELLNNQWKQMSLRIGLHTLYNCIPFVDMSMSMSENGNELLYSAIGFGCLIAERSSFGKRIMVIDQYPTWINLSECYDFFSMIENIEKNTISSRNTMTNINNAFELLIEPFIDTNSQKKLSTMNCVILSSFREYTSGSHLHTNIEDQFFNKGLPCPKMVYWNLSDSFIEKQFVEYNKPNVIMLSGLSAGVFPSLYNYDKKNTYDVIENILNNNRYDCISNYLNNISTF